jgi:predicted nucleic acid-binding protein
MKNIIALLDTNIPLDSFSKREPFKASADKILTACREGKFDGFIAAHSITNIFYILRKDYSADERKDMLRGLCDILGVIGIDYEKLIEALNDDSFDDIEDCLQSECAEAVNADYIVTRDPKGFVNSPIKVVSPEEFLKILEENSVEK